MTTRSRPAAESAQESRPANGGPVTLQSLEATFGRRWRIDEASGGWYAVRLHSVSELNVSRGMSNVRCGRTLEELAGYLAEEKRIETRCQF